MRQCLGSAAARTLHPRRATPLLASAASLSSPSSSTHYSRPSSSSRSMATSSSSSRSGAPAKSPSPRAKWDNVTQAQDEAVLTTSDNGTRIYWLNREKKHHALDQEMIDILERSIDDWSDSKLAKILIGRGKGGKAFCAGGDIKQIAKMASSEATRGDAMAFFKKEFEVDWKLASFSVGLGAWDGSKTYICVMDGLTMGGGAGLSFGAAIRVATEKTQFAMPETIIGYTPDVGATHYLSLLDGKIGRYLAMTGSTFKGREVFDLGLATHYIPSHSVSQLVERLQSVEDIDQQGGIDGLVSIIQDYEVRSSDAATRRWRADEPDSPSRFVGPVRRVLDHAFSQSSVEGVKKILSEYTRSDLAALADEDERAVAAWAGETLAILESRSPISLAITLKGMTKAEEDIKSVGKALAAEGKRYESVPPNEALRLTLEREYRAVEQFVHNVSPDFPSGVIRKLIDKLPPSWDTTSDPEALAAQFFTSPSSPLRPSTQPLSLLPPTHGFDMHPFRAFGLPSEAQIGAVVRGEAPGSGDMSLTRDMVLARFDTTRAGVREKVEDVLDRKAAATQEGGFLRWKSSDEKFKYKGGESRALQSKL